MNDLIAIAVIEEPVKLPKKPRKKHTDGGYKNNFVGAIISGISGLLTGGMSLAGNLIGKNKDKGKTKDKPVIDKRTGSIDITYILAIVTVAVLVIVAFWIGINKLKKAKK